MAAIDVKNKSRKSKTARALSDQETEVPITSDMEAKEAPKKSRKRGIDKLQNSHEPSVAAPDQASQNIKTEATPVNPKSESLEKEKLDSPVEQPTSRKRDAEEAELEIDIDAPEPPSKKALRKAKKAKVSNGNTSSSTEKHSKPSTAKQDEARDSENKRSDYGIWIGNLSFNTTKEDLSTFLTTNATAAIREDQITRIHLPQGPPKFGKSQNKGFAYVDFSDKSGLEKGLALTESMLAGRRVLIKNSKSFEGRPEKKDDGGKPAHPPSRRIFVGNLDFATTAEDLEAHFGVCGRISHMHMATFEDSGKCKGFAWVEFDEIASAEKAMRGWVDADAGGGAENAASKPQFGKRKIWVNRIEGRKLRMEYAEDKAVRYEKRFGKNAKKVPAKEDEAVGEDAIVEVNDEKPSSNQLSSERRSKRVKPQGKYSEETVQKLTGAIVESQGQRKVFD